jgi:hypothetical protein
MIVNGFEVKGVIKVDNVRVYGIEESIVASSYPMQTETFNMNKYICCDGTYEDMIGETDMKRAKHLGTAIPGSGHDCMNKGITLQFDLQVSEYIWRQLDRYHFIDYVSSQSKMHRILKMDIDKACNKYVSKSSIRELNYWINLYNNFDETNFTNDLILRNNEEIEFTKENIFKLIIANTPSGIMLTARMTTNYLQLKSIIGQRSQHKLHEWRLLCDYFKTLPLANEIVVKE